MGALTSILGIASAAQPSSMTSAANAVQGMNAGSAGGAAGTVAGVGATPSTAATSSTGGGFGDVVVKALDGLQSVQGNADSLAVKAATGDLTDVSNYTIAASQANLATDFTVALRDKAVEAFQSIMGMQV
jgi:flagellar hook-basal body complex protein FliE